MMGRREEISSYRVYEFTGKSPEEMIGILDQSIGDLLERNHNQQVSSEEILPILIRLSIFIGELQKRKQENGHIPTPHTSLLVITAMRNFLVSKKGSTMMPRKILIIISRKLQEIAESERRIVKYKKRLSEYANRTRDTLGEANAIPEVIDYSSQYLVFLKEKITNISETDPEELKKNIYMREFLKEADAILKYAPKNLFKDSNRAEKYTAIPTKYESDFCALHASIREIVTLIHRKFGRDILRVEWIESLGLLKSPKQKEEVYSPSPTEARTLFYGERLVGILAQTSTLQEIILSTLKSGKGQENLTSDMKALLTTLSNNKRFLPIIAQFLGTEKNFSEPEVPRLPWYSRLLRKKQQHGENDFWKDGKNANITELRKICKPYFIIKS